MSTTLTVNGIIFTFQDSNVSSVRSSIQSKVETIEISGTGPMGSLNLDYDGSRKTITVKGRLTAAVSDRTSVGTCKTILAQKQWLESLINGAQSKIDFASTYETNSVTGVTGKASPYQGAFTGTDVMVQSMDFEEQEANPSELPFTITLTVGAV